MDLKYVLLSITTLYVVNRKWQMA